MTVDCIVGSVVRAGAAEHLMLFLVGEVGWPSIAALAMESVEVRLNVQSKARVSRHRSASNHDKGRRVPVHHAENIGGTRRRRSSKVTPYSSPRTYIGFRGARSFAVRGEELLIGRPS